MKFQTFFFTEECKRSEEKELEFKRINVKYEILQKEKTRLDIELKGWFIKHIAKLNLICILTNTTFF